MRIKEGSKILLGVIYVLFIGCQSNPNTTNIPNQPDEPDAGWNIPVNFIISGGVPKDGIPSLFNPPVIPAAEANYLSDSDLVVGIVVNGQPRAYPHTILDWHEVVNEDFPDLPLTISFCPLTGTAIVFEGKNAGRKLTFGVSGLLFNDNLIMFDRQTDSHWPQMRLQCDQGTLRNTKQKLYPSIETAWGSWKKLFPNTVILSTNTGFARPYDRPGSAYPGYTNLNSAPLFPQLTFRDDRLPPKQRVHGIILGDDADQFVTRVYVIDNSRPAKVRNDTFMGEPILVIEDGTQNFIVSYFRRVKDKVLTFKINGTASNFPFTLKDMETGTVWNLLGEAVEGPLAGTKLEKTKSYNAYWFAWGAFFRNAEIIE